MKKNRKVFIIFMLLAVVAVALWLTRSTTTFRRNLSDFRLNDSSAVTKVFMSDKNNNSVTLTKLAPGNWLVNDKYKAQNYNIDLLLKTMIGLEVQQPVARAAHNNIIREMAVNSVKVEIYQQVYRISLSGRFRWFPHEKLVKVYYVGNATQDNQGAFMLMQGSDEPFIVFLPGFRGFVSPRFSPIEKVWRDYNIFRKQIGEIATVRVEIPETPDYSYEVKSTANNRFSLTALTGNKVVPDYDTLKLLNFLSGFRNLNYEALINDMDQYRKDSIIKSQPFLVITLTDTSGFATKVVTYHKHGPPGQTDPNGVPMPYDLDRLYALVNDGKDFVLIQYFTFDKVLRPLPFFYKEAAGRR